MAPSAPLAARPLAAARPAASPAPSPASVQPTAQPAARRRRGLPRLRVLPMVMFAGVLMIGVRVSDLWTGFANVSTSGRAAQAEEEGEAGVPAEMAAATPEMLALPEDGTADGAALPVDPTLPESQQALVEGLAARRAGLDDRARDLDRREALLAVAEQRLDQKLAELTSLRGEVEGMVDQVDEQRENQIKTLVGIYEAMRPGDAAVIFNGLDMEVLLAVLQRMREQKSAPILAGMNPERARQVTAELMERQALAVTPQMPAAEPVATGLPLLPPPPAQ